MFPGLTNRNNTFIESDGFYVSYNPDTDTGPETALVHRTKDPGYLILLGDYREQYTPLVAISYQACLDFFLAQPLSARSPWSELPDNF